MIQATLNPDQKLCFSVLRGLTNPFSKHSIVRAPIAVPGGLLGTNGTVGFLYWWNHTFPMYQRLYVVGEEDDSLALVPEELNADEVGQVKRLIAGEFFELCAFPIRKVAGIVIRNGGFDLDGKAYVYAGKDGLIVLVQNWHIDTEPQSEFIGLDVSPHTPFYIDLKSLWCSGLSKLLPYIFRDGSIHYKQDLVARIDLDVAGESVSLFTRMIYSINLDN